MRGFGICYDLVTGTMRQWYAGADGIKRWVDNHQPVNPIRPATHPTQEADK